MSYDPNALAAQLARQAQRDAEVIATRQTLAARHLPSGGAIVRDGAGFGGKILFAIEYVSEGGVCLTPHQISIRYLEGLIRQEPVYSIARSQNKYALKQVREETLPNGDTLLIYSLIE